MGTKTLIGIAAVILTLCAFGLTIASLAVPIWYNIDVESVTVQLGLFQTCTEVLGFKICVPTPAVTDTFQATRWLVVAGNVVIGIALLFGLLLMCTKNACVAKSACALDIIGGLCILAAVIITAIDSHASYLTSFYGVSFILACIALSLAIIAGVLFVFAKTKKSGTAGHVIQPI